MILNSVWSCWTVIKSIFCIDKWQWMYVTWIHYFTPESNRQSADWTKRDKPDLKRPKTQQSVDKVMASVFWDANGILFINYVKMGRTINSDYYIALLERLKEEIAKKRPHMLKKRVLFHQDNAPCPKNAWIRLAHQTRSPDLATGDFFLFANLKRMLAGKKFSSEEEVITKTEAFLRLKRNCTFKMVLKVWKNAGMSVSPSKVEFCKKKKHFFLVFFKKFQSALLVHSF